MPTDEEIRIIILRKKWRRAMIRRIVAGALLLIVLFLLLMSSQTSSFDYSVMKAIGDESAEAPEIKAEAASLYSLDLDRPVYEKNADEKIDPYSITKILTCYLAYENLDPNEKITITKETAEKEYKDGAYILLYEDEVVTVNDLLHATMLSSANDAAHALAIAVAGSEKKFAEMMNEQVKEWGCENTHFVNPNGWKNKNHYTTAHDMAIITKHCFDNEDVKKLSMVKEYTVPASNKYEYDKPIFNVFLKIAVEGIDNITCGKTGSWEDDDCSIVLEFEEDYLSSVMVLLRDTKKKRSEDIRKLMEFSHVVTPGFQVAAEGDAVAIARVKYGAETEVALTIDKTIKAYPKDGIKKNIKVLLNPAKLEAPLAKGAEAGNYTVMLDGRELESGKLYVAKDIEKGWILSRFYISNEKTLLGGTIVLVAVAFIIILRVTARKSGRKRN